MERNTIITFANQKGGVGKTTLCTLFANYLASKGESVLVVDCDRQQSIVEKRKKDISKYTEAEIPYNVQPFDINNVDNVNVLMKNLKTMDGIILIDSPGNLAQQGLVPLFANVDYIVCPYFYEGVSIDSTAKFIAFINGLQDRIESMKTELFFVVNKWDKRFGTKQELALWKQTEETLKKYGKIIPNIEYRAEMQRYNTIELFKKQESIVGIAFDFLYQNIKKK